MTGPRIHCPSRLKEAPELGARPQWSDDKLRRMNRAALRLLVRHHRDMFPAAYEQNLIMDGKRSRPLI
jgi:hypothetical protein